jgi:hypothetical protein
VLIISLKYWEHLGLAISRIVGFIVIAIGYNISWVQLSI